MTNLFYLLEKRKTEKKQRKKPRKHRINLSFIKWGQKFRKGDFPLKPQIGRIWSFFTVRWGCAKTHLSSLIPGKNRHNGVYQKNEQ